MKSIFFIALYINTALATAVSLLFFGYSVFTKSWISAGLSFLAFNICLLLVLYSLEKILEE